MDDEQEMDNPLLERALDMYAKDYKMNAIAKELNVHTGTVRRWFKKIGIPARRKTFAQPKKAQPILDRMSDDPLGDDIEENLENFTDQVIRVAKHEARIAEDSSMIEIAEAQSTPADKYQHYMAAAGIKLLRDSIKNLKGPKTVRELSELDQMIRRNLGLNSKSGGGTSKMHIDISILNNVKADRGDGSVNKVKQTIIDIEPD